MPPSTTFNHRLAHFSDLAAIVDIYNSTVASREVTADTEPVTAASRVGWFNEHLPSSRPLWVVEQTDGDGNLQIIGWLSYSNFYGRPAYSGTAELSIYVHASMRGKGLGCYLLTQAIAFAPQLAVHTLLGFIFGHNQASLALFDQFGFERWAQMPRVATLDGIERDLIIVGKRVA